MKARLAPPKIRLISRAGASALLLAAWCSAPLAATGVDVECPESESPNQLVATDVEIPKLVIPTMTIDVADHGVDSSADVQEPIVDVPLANPTVTSTDADDESVPEVDHADTPVIESPPTATRLPGVSETDQPRYRRQMYRKDI